ncbi:uncharacterized protein MYCFIDRAFT_42052 [Pseudocercospora fijiensis CIRAD86]|uniref:Pre-rRNA processing protein n=1 Tax=Pseudocercospora fijiensis (strain CIRAD86) TaxID=383855 RepID=M3B6U4_PSEFD|nr:uncharacterized protein MYCFIDRAFT_42052 [Pseudocercospora fijiensis CIRAD86]EME85062.1 hypothetical protein MYCFIDRAFT_42052 [Pseudocercospora fijiensis CIRAD86]
MAANSEPDPTRQQEEEDESDVRDVEDGPTESSPLLPRHLTHNDQSQPHREQSATSSLKSVLGKNGKPRWPSLIALLLLCVLAALIIVFAFVAPAAVEQYAAQAVVFEPTSLSIESFTATGVRARVQGTFKLDSSRVEKQHVRNLGKFCTWIAREAETGESDVRVSLPEYGNVLLGTAHVPPIKVYLRDQHITGVDFLADLEPGNVDGIRRIANDWIDGRLGRLRVVGKASVPIKSGLISLGRQIVKQEMLFDNKDTPTLPAYKLQKLNLREVEIPSGTGMAADVSLQVHNDYPVDLAVPPLGFGILVDNCEKSDPYIMVADALTHELNIHPKQDVEVNVTGMVRQLPSVLTEDCPGTSESPLDNLIAHYIHGKTTTVYVQGSDSSSLDTPEWITDLMKDITVPVPIPGRTYGDLIKNFSLTDTQFSLPDPWAEPDTPESNPRISAKVRALVALPEEMNFNISVAKVKADADVFYKGKKIGRLDLNKWQAANSTRVPPESEEDGPTLEVESLVKDAPLEIQDENVFTDVIQELLFGGKTVIMTIKAEVDVGVATALGEFAIRKIPADGQVPIKHLLGGVKPKLVDVNISNTTETSLTIDAKVNVTNPTPYSASIPYIDIHILKNGSLLGHATAHNLTITTGRNSFLEVTAIYSPLDSGGKPAKEIGRNLISQYISGWNTTLTFRTHEKTFPSNPKLGRVLSHFPLEIQAPNLSPQPPNQDPEEGGGGGGGAHNFIKDATMHLLTSTATFVLFSPLTHSTLIISSLNATAIYESSDVGEIFYDIPFAVPPVAETPDHQGFLTPRLPVDWSLGSVGYEAVKKALGGTLKLKAKAEVGVKLGRWREKVWFEGGGLGVRIRL